MCKLKKEDDRRYRGSDEYYEDRYLRMRVQNRYRWSAWMIIISTILTLIIITELLWNSWNNP